MLPNYFSMCIELCYLGQIIRSELKFCVTYYSNPTKYYEHFLHRSFIFIKGGKFIDLG